MTDENNTKTIRRTIYKIKLHFQEKKFKLKRKMGNKMIITQNEPE